VAIDEKDFIQLDEKYQSGVAIDRYKGICLVAARRGKDGNIYADWAFNQTRDKTPSDKATPKKIFLGDDPFEAIETMRKIAGILKEGRK
jgi:hypothetical protein